MSKYSIYYDMDSCDKYLDMDDSIKSDKLGKAVSLIEYLSETDDAITIYHTILMLRAMIRGHEDKTKCILELHDARKGVCFSKEFTKNNLKVALDSDFEEYIEDPLKYGFSAESF